MDNKFKQENFLELVNAKRVYKISFEVGPWVKTNAFKDSVSSQH